MKALPRGLLGARRAKGRQGDHPTSWAPKDGEAIRGSRRKNTRGESGIRKGNCLQDETAEGVGG